MSQESALSAAQLSNAIYGGKVPPGYSVIVNSNPSTSGFNATSYLDSKTNTLYIVYRGTEPGEIGDIAADSLLLFNYLGKQFAEADTFYQQSLDSVGSPDVQVVVTGHSLGGALAAHVGMNTGDTTYTFNAPGIGGIASNGGPTASPDSYTNVTNFRSTSDPVSMYGTPVGNTVDISYSSAGLIPAWTTLGLVISIFNQHGIGGLEAALRDLSSVNPDYIDGYTYNPEDSNWYLLPPSATNDEWGGQASGSVKGYLDVKRSMASAAGESANAWASDVAQRAVEAAQAAFRKAETTRSPIIIDLDGDGVETLAEGSGIHFDHDGNGFAESTGWAGKDDAFLVADLNGDGKIDTGRELFGDNTLLADGRRAANGFAALATYDSNKDGVVDALDADFSKLRLWRDANSDGEVQAGELLGLADFKIAGINTSFTEHTTVDAQGNVHKQQGTAIDDNGNIVAASDVWFAVDKLDTISSGDAPISEEIARLPQLKGFGNVSDLQQAIANDLSGELKGLLERFASEPDLAKRKALVIDIVYHWAGVEDVDPNGRAATQIYGNVIGDARKLAVLEKFLAEDYLGTWCWGERDPNPHGPAASILLQTFDRLVSTFYGQLMVQTHFEDAINAVKVRFDENGISLDTKPLVASLFQEYQAAPDQAAVYFSELTGALKALGEIGEQILTSLRAEGKSGDSEFYHALMGIGIYAPTLAADDIFGTERADTLDGLGGNDRIHGDSGDDIIIGGRGDDYLNGGDGADTYLINIGDGHDTILNADADALGVAKDRIVFGVGILPDDVKVERNAYDLVLRYNNGLDQVIVQSYFDVLSTNNHGYAVDEIVFSDGTIWTPNDVFSSLVRTSEGADTIESYDSDDVVYGMGGEDVISGQAGNDELYGDAGDDQLYGQLGDDLLSGGKGNDYLSGGRGSDTYVFALGDGQDTVADRDDNLTSSNGPSQSVDTLYFKDILVSDIASLQRVGDDLVIRYSRTDKVTVERFYWDQSQYGVESFKFADSVELSYEQLIELYPILTPMELTGSTGNDILEGGKSDDTLSGAQGDDTYVIRLGGGVDKINNREEVYGPNGSASHPGNDEIFFVDILPADIKSVRRDGDDLVIEFGQYDSVTVLRQFNNPYQNLTDINSFRFSDGTVFTAKELYARYEMRWGTESNDFIPGSTDDDVLQGLQGNDHIRGGKGKDTITGGVGNDSLEGETGDDTYVFSKGDGNDYVNLYAGNWPEPAGVDYIRFTDVTQVGELKLEQRYDELIIRYGDSDSIRIAQYFTSMESGLAGLILADGKQVSIDELISQIGISWNADGSGSYVGREAADYLVGTDGNDYFLPGAGDDVVIGGKGNDSITGSWGNDRYIFSAGDGVDSLSLGWIVEEKYEGFKDVIQFTDVNKSDLRSVKFVDNMVIIDYGSADSLTINRSGANSYWDFADANIVFANGETVLLSELGNINSVILGSNADDFLFGTDANDQIDGGLGNDVINGRDGNDVIHGGKGKDTLTGGNGSDVYTFARGDGSDVIDNFESEALEVDGKVFHAGKDSIRFQDVNSSDIVGIEARNGDLIINYGADDQIILKKYLYPDDSEGWRYRISSVEFADGQIIPLPKLIEMYPPAWGSDYDDGILGSPGSDVIRGLAGNDVISGQDGDDILDGGSGDDVMRGGRGHNTYVLTRNSGNDTIVVFPDKETVDTIEFVDCVQADITGLRKDGDSLVVSYGNNSSFYLFGVTSNETSYVDTFKFADGSVLTFSQLLAQHPLAWGTDGDDWFSGTWWSDYLTGGAGNDSISAGRGDDHLDGGLGNDYLSGEEGDDTFHFTKGSGEDVVSTYEAIFDEASQSYRHMGRDTVAFDDILIDEILSVTRDGDSLLIRYGENDSVRIDSVFSYEAYKLDGFKFADSSTYTFSEFLSHFDLDETGQSGSQQPPEQPGGEDNATVLYGTSGDDNLKGSDTIFGIFGGDGNDVIRAVAPGSQIYGENGNDTLIGGDGYTYMAGGEGDDYLLGRAGDAVLIGGAGDDIIISGAGSDLMAGGSGSDLYCYFQGSGHDAIYNLGEADSEIDVLRFNDVTFNNLWFSRENGQLRIDVLDSNGVSAGQVDVIESDWTGLGIDQIQSADNGTLLASQVDNLINVMASFGVSVSEGFTLSSDQKEALNTVLAANVSYAS